MNVIRLWLKVVGLVLPVAISVSLHLKNVTSSITSDFIHKLLDHSLSLLVLLVLEIDLLPFVVRVEVVSGHYMSLSQGCLLKLKVSFLVVLLQELLKVEV